MICSYTLWLVGSDDGRVRKLRVTFARVIGVLLIAVLICSAGLFYVSRATGANPFQIAQSSKRQAFKKVVSERNQLLLANHTLTRKVHNFEDANERVDAYETAVKQRLSKLGEILESAGSLGIYSKKEIAQLNSKSKKALDGVGGLELDCAVGLRDDCELVGEEDSASSFAGLAIDENGGLIEVLDSYIAALNSIPFGQPVEGRISSHYGRRKSPFTGRYKMHQGMDFANRTGTDIHVTADGVVKRVKYDRTYGRLIDVIHSASVITRYAHLSKALVKPGQKVKRGDIIGKVGSTGRSTGPHLHYEVRVNNRAKNPKATLELGQKLAALVR